MTRRLSKENFDKVIEALKIVGESEREEGEPALPTLGRILREIGVAPDDNYRHFNRLVRRMCKNWHTVFDLEMWTNFLEICGHRTDADLDVGFVALMKDEAVRQMPTPAMLLSGCGVWDGVRRDGSKI